MNTITFKNKVFTFTAEYYESLQDSPWEDLSDIEQDRWIKSFYSCNSGRVASIR